MCDLELSIEGTEIEQRIATGQRGARGARARRARTTGCRTSGSRPTASRASPCRSIWRTRGSRSSSSRRCSRSKAATRTTCLKILRHEAGHAIDNAYQLRRRPTRRRLFGTPATPYPEYYTPKPYSKSFVQHLDHWYAQSHPDEDFAETFAVWLDPAVDWSTRYAGWPAHRKLEYMDRLMREPARASRRSHGRSARSIRCRSCARRSASTTGRSASTTGSTHPDFYESDLRNLFSDAPAVRRRTCRRRGSCAGSARTSAAPSPASPTATSTRSISSSRRSSSAAAS